MGYALGKIASKVAQLYGIDHIIVSGGAAVNSYIIRGVRTAVSSHDLKLYIPNKVPAGDGGIALGQVAIAGARFIDD